MQTVRTNTPFFYFLYHNQVEFKGRRDPLTVQGYHLIRGRTHLYLGEQEIPPEQMVVTEELLTEISPEKRKRILELLLKMNIKLSDKKRHRTSGIN